MVARGLQRLLHCRAPLQSVLWRSLLPCPAPRQPPVGPLGARCIRTLCPRPRWVSTSGVPAATAPRSTSSGDEARRTPTETGTAAEISTETDPLQDKSISILQRFKRTFKQYGKVMIPVHLVTSSVWFGTFYYAAMKGVNVVPFLEVIGFPEKIVNLLQSSQSGHAITAYAMYKIATPARYTMTLGGTSLSVKYLRKKGYMSTPPPVKVYLQDKMEATRERISEKMEETKGRISGKMEETKDRFSGRMEETKDKLTEKLQETKDKVSFRKRAE
ncbi:uncharacterized protein C18orf19 homolog A [Megalops cyprinoides]|uniref:uncharacterized protein C18orf19 homolog A n=1 Tax=Megalops cyprinoides TaxID=118141 RepID=UPI001863BF14|nr:uncharacterized protein C18orf19 homolog A [Megalops cyprinoides]XP_036371821.1 uncharacterized protein C18orf19 homolog A [Megalops cyprinoides]